MLRNEQKKLIKFMKGASRNNGYRNIVFDEREPKWSRIEPKEVQVIKYECNEQLDCEEVVQGWDIKIAENPFAEGGMRIAYYGLMLYKGEWQKAVFKEYKCIDQGANKKEKYLELLDCQTVAAYLAKEFNKLSSLTKVINFVMTKLVFEPIGPRKYRNLTMERFIDGSYKKFSDNDGGVDYDNPSATLQAFSHWTYERTNGNMMVVDLQGIVDRNNKYFLTDPCIHSTNLKRFGRTNLGKPGMKRFFQTHICNAICLALKLKRNEHQPDIRVAKYDSYFVNKPNRTMFN